MDVRETSGSVAGIREFALDLDRGELLDFLEVLITAEERGAPEASIAPLRELAMNAVDAGAVTLDLDAEGLTGLLAVLRRADGVHGHFPRRFPGDLALLAERALGEG